MAPLVVQLQAECLDSRVSILEILRKALVVARKLSLADAEVWIAKELNGYKTGDGAPDYRMLTGQIRMWNPYHGWIPVFFQDTRQATMLSKCYAGQAIGELEDLLEHGDGILEFPFDPATERDLMKGQSVPLRPTRHLSRSSVSGIIDAVRNMVLEWCLKLEKDGILGEGLMFSEKEKAAAAAASYTINYNAPVTNSQVQQNASHSSQRMQVREVDGGALADFIRVLNEHVWELGLGQTEAQRMQSEIAKLESEAAVPEKNSSAVHQSLQTIRNVLEGCAGSLVTSGLLFELGKLMQ